MLARAKYAPLLTVPPRFGPMAAFTSPSALRQAARAVGTHKLNYSGRPKIDIFLWVLQPPSPPRRRTDHPHLLTLRPTPKCATSTVRRPWRSLRTVRLRLIDVMLRYLRPERKEHGGGTAWPGEKRATDGRQLPARNWHGNGLAD